MATGLSGISVHATSPVARVERSESGSASRDTHAGQRCSSRKAAWVSGFVGTFLALIGVVLLVLMVSGTGQALRRRITSEAAETLQVVHSIYRRAGREEADHPGTHQEDEQPRRIINKDHPQAHSAKSHESAHRGAVGKEEHREPRHGSAGHIAAHEDAADNKDNQHLSQRLIGGHSFAAAIANATAATSPATVQRTRHGRCRGGPSAACECLLSCKVFGGRAEQCVGEDHDLSDLMDRRIQGAMGGVEDACAGMQCMVACAQRLDCYDAAVQKACRYLIAKANEDRCLVDCSAGMAVDKLAAVASKGSKSDGLRGAVRSSGIEAVRT